MSYPASSPLMSQQGLPEARNGSLSDVATEGMLPLVTKLVDAVARDPKALWSSFSMIIVSRPRLTSVLALRIAHTAPPPAWLYQVSEIGDKTFLIAAILAMRHSRLVVFAGAFASLVVMSILSAALGAAFPSLLPKSLTTLLASLLFLVFGAKMWSEGRQMSGDEMGEEWEEAKKKIEGEETEEHELRRTEEHDIEQGHGSHDVRLAGFRAAPRIRIHTSSSSLPGADSKAKVGAGVIHTFKDGAKNLCDLCFSPVFGQAFVLTFLGEWGDRSQIATIALAAAHVSVTLVEIGSKPGTDALI